MLHQPVDVGPAIPVAFIADHAYGNLISWNVLSFVDLRSVAELTTARRAGKHHELGSHCSLLTVKIVNGVKQFSFRLQSVELNRFHPGAMGIQSPSFFKVILPSGVIPDN